MKKILSLMFIASMVIGLMSCSDDDELYGMKEYVSIYPQSFKVLDKTVTSNRSKAEYTIPISIEGSDNYDVTYEFILTNFAPESYTIEHVILSDEGYATSASNKFVIGTEVMAGYPVDISSKAGASTITGSFKLKTLFPSPEVGQMQMIRLRLKSAADNESVPEPFIEIYLGEAQ